MTEQRQILEIVTKFNNKRIRKEDYDVWTHQAAHSYGFYMSAWWMAGTVIVSTLMYFVRNWIYFYVGYHATDRQFFTFFFFWGIASTIAIYNVLFHYERRGLVDLWLEHLEAPTEVVERSVDAPIINFADGVNAADTYLVNGNLEPREVRPRMIDGLTINGRIVQAMKRCVEAFNAQEGTSLTEAQGWRFMIQLKYARATAGKFNIDDYEDMSAYSALAAECEANENEQRQEMQIFNARMVLRAKDMQDRQDARRQVSADLMP